MPAEHSTTSPETFLPVKDAPHVRVSNFGRVFALDDSADPYAAEPGAGWREAKLTPHTFGYPVFRFNRNGKTYRRYVHRLVLEAFVGPRPPGMQCRHLDGNPANNRLDNLAWGTGVENARDKLRHGTNNNGTRHVLSKLTEADIPEIRRLHGEGLSMREVGQRFGVCAQTVCDIVNRWRWHHVP